MEQRILEEDINRIWGHIQLSELSGKSILITGGTGLIGSYFLYTLKKLNNVSRYKTKVYVVIQMLLFVSPCHVRIISFMRQVTDSRECFCRIKLKLSE